MPACTMSLLHSMHGLVVTYRVLPSLELLLRATLVIALASACNTYGNVSPWASSQRFSKPEGVPLYPSEIIMLSRTRIAPTLRRVQYEFSAQMKAMRRYRASSCVCLESMLILMCGGVIADCERSGNVRHRGRHGNRFLQRLWPDDIGGRRRHRLQIHPVCWSERWDVWS